MKIILSPENVRQIASRLNVKEAEVVRHGQSVYLLQINL